METSLGTVSSLGKTCILGRRQSPVISSARSELVSLHSRVLDNANILNIDGKSGVTLKNATETCEQCIRSPQKTLLVKIFEVPKSIKLVIKTSEFFSSQRIPPVSHQK